jgi:hypothetical protein
VIARVRNAGAHVRNAIAHVETPMSFATAQAIADQFDRRNGTDYFAKLLADNEALIEFSA